MMLATLRYVPAFMLPKTISQIGSPKAKKVDKSNDENNMLDFSEKLILDLIIVLSFNLLLSISLDCSLIDGIIVTASEPMSVDGIISNGKVIPIIIPNSERASVFDKPNVCSLNGMITAIIEDIREETVRIAVIGELVFSKLLNSFLGLASVPPDLK